MHTYTGSCHCGAVAYRVEADIQKVIECNCSHCHRKGLLLTFVPETAFTLERGHEHLTEYRFNKKHIAHLFCTTCGTQSFAKAINEEGVGTIAINVRTIPDLDTEILTTEKVNGKDY